MIVQIFRDLFCCRILLFLFIFRYSSSLSTKYCKADIDCSTNEYCSLSRVCLCRERLVKLPGRHYECLETREPGQECQHDVQCHQNLKLGLICEQHKCTCPNNFEPTNGRCPSIAAKFSSPLHHFNNDQKLSFFGSRFNSKALLIVGVTAVSLLMFTLMFIFGKMACRRRKDSVSSPATEFEESTSMLRRQGRTSRPPSYSSLPPPSYEFVASNLLPAGVTAWWRGLQTVEENETEGVVGGGQIAPKSSYSNEEGCSKPLGTGTLADSSPSAPLLNENSKFEMGGVTHNASLKKETKL